MANRNQPPWRRCPQRGAALVLAVLCIVAAGPTAASPVEPALEKGLSKVEEQALSEAYARDDLVTMRAIIIAAIATSSERSAEIVRDAFRLIPLRAATIIEQAGKTFPPLAERLKTVAAEIIAPKKTAKTVPPVRSPPEEPAPQAEFAPDETRFGDWSGETVIGGNYRNGAQDSLSAHAAFKVTQKIGKWKNTGAFDFDFARSNGITNSQDIEIKGRARRDLDENLFGFGIASYEDDRFSGFDYQITEGVGVGYQIFDTEDLRLSLEGGPSLRHNLVTQTDEFNNELLLRVASILEWTISDTAKLSNELALLLTRNSIELDSSTFGEVRDSSESTNVTALDLQIIGNLAARLSYEVHFRSNPPQGGQATESTARVSLVHSF